MPDLPENILPTNLLPRHRELPGRIAGRELLVREPSDDRVHFLNAAATLIWNCCDGQTSMATCAERLRSEFSIPADIDVETDIRAALADFAAKGLLETEPFVEGDASAG